MSTTSLRIYLAGPNVFYRDPQLEGTTLVELCAKHGHTGLFPLDNELPASDSVDTAIFHANVALLDSADIVVANLTPFRGPESDIGTVWEVAYAFAKGKPVHGYSTCGLTLVEKLSQTQTLTREEDTLRCAQDWAVENFGHPFNLMLMNSLSSFTVGTLEDVMTKGHLALHVPPRP